MRARRDLFPDAYPPDRPERAHAGAWDTRWPVPMPQDQSPVLVCPVCSGPVVVKDWKYHTRAAVGSSSPWRCDVRTKCAACALVLTYGVAVPRERFAAAQAAGGLGVQRWIHWREARLVLDRAGYFAPVDT